MVTLFHQHLFNHLIIAENYVLHIAGHNLSVHGEVISPIAIRQRGNRIDIHLMLFCLTAAVKQNSAGTAAGNDCNADHTCQNLFSCFHASTSCCVPE